jgi:membrane-associated protease RseP (regulator of RpoE activity)
MSFSLGVIIFVVAVLISVILHEAGHYATAKAFGMKVTQFFIGFGPTLLSIRRGETEYGVKVLPFGAFVRITGMTNLDEVDQADEPRSMRNKPTWQRVTVMAAGSFMHFALAFVLLLFLALAIGQPIPDKASSIGSVSSCVPVSATALSDGSCAGSKVTSPAKLAGVEAGDRVIAIDGKPVRTWTQLGDAIRAHPVGKLMLVTVLRSGKRLTLDAYPAHYPGRKSSSYLGIGEAEVFQPYGPAGAVTFSGSAFGQVLVGSADAFGKLPAAIPDLFSKNRANTPAGDVSSVYGAADFAGQAVAQGGGWQYSVSDLLLIIVSLNIFIGAFNLLPLLPMDGGHIAVIAYERFRYWLARLFGRPDPGLVDMQRLMPVYVGVFGLLIFLGVLLMAADIFNPVHIPQ